ncbi:binary toxin-like calcium binding domain-containing protein [Bacillus solimangrovi]|uniref:PA14 domain-containing protein n=1 Tax=Bacillus solimangrovi TaxID=1305675 RepID=A0A1E5LI66_9BACI|nr:binary toxin-like calcium binding domain-containing protein [Bacillus solimangrovi]OEH93767.1 hypothetical protein BFG57_11325 [Bacillus solimangrovi]
MKQSNYKRRFVSVLTTLALTTQLLPTTHSTAIAKTIEDEPRQTNSQEINDNPIIKNGLEGAYYTDAQFSEPVLIRLEDSDALYDLDVLNIPNFIKKKLENVHSIKWEGTIEPQYSEEYQFTTSDNEHIKLWINDELLINGLNFEPLPIVLEADELYHIRVAYSNPDRPLTELDIKWSSDSQEEEIISKEHIFLLEHGEDEDYSISSDELIVDELEEVIEEPVVDLLEIPEEVVEEQIVEIEPTEEIIEPTEEQVEEEVTEPTEEQVEEEVTESTEEQAEEEITEPTEEQIEEETTESTEEQVEEEVSEPTEEQVEEEITESTEEQAEEEITESTEEQAEEEVTKPTEKQVKEIEDTDNQEDTSILSKSELFGSTTGLSNLVGMSSSSSSNQDADGDNIYDVWEKEGYTYVLGAGIVKWDDKDADNYGEGAIKYVTSPFSRSTDEDPYSDYEEVTGQVDKGIAAIAQHPLVPAFPDIQAEIEGVSITPYETITTTDGTVLTEAWSESTDKSETTARSLGYKAGFEVAIEKNFKIQDPGVKVNTKIYGESNGQWDKSNTETTSRVDSNQDTTSWSQATATNPSQAATSVWNVKYTNKGTAPAYNITPSLSLQIGDKTAISLTTDSASKINSIAPNESYPSGRDTVALKYTETGTNDTNQIFLTIDQVQLIQMGYPISLSTDQIRANVKQLEDDGSISANGDWNLYEAAIDAVSASITYVHPTKGEEKFKVFANNPELNHAQHDPKTTLGDALKLVLDAEVVNGKFIVDGEEVNDSWRIFLSSEEDDDFDIFQQEEDLFDIELRPGMDIVLEKTDLNGSPAVQYVFYGEDGKQVVARVAENGSEIQSVTASVKTSSGELIDLPLDDIDENGVYDGIYESRIQANQLNISYKDAILTATDVNGNKTIAYILAPYGVSKQGLGYVPLARTKVVNDITSLPEQYPNAEAFVFEVKNSSMTTNMRRADIGNQRVYLGVNDYPIEYKAPGTTYTLFENNDYSGSRYALTSSITDLRSGAYGYNSPMSNKASSVKFDYSKLGAGIVLYNFYDHRQQDDVLALTGSDRNLSNNSIDFNDRTSSVRIIGQRGKPFVRLYENNKDNIKLDKYGTDYVDVYGDKDISGFFNDDAASFHVIGGANMNYFINPTFKEHSDGTGSGHRWWDVDSYLRLTNLPDSVRNEVSYVKIECEYCPSFTLYKDKNYGGGSAYTNVVTPEIDTLYNGLKYFDLGIASSIKVRNNSDNLAKLIIYKGNGDYAVIDKSVPDLSSFEDVIYKGKSSGTRNFDNEIKDVKLHYGAVYRFFEHTNYNGAYQDYIIGEDNIGSDWNNKFSSVKVLNKLPEIGLIAFDKTNYDYSGDYLPINGDIPDLRTVGFNDKISSLKLITRIPELRPYHNTTVVVSSKDLSFEAKNRYFGGSTSVKLVGYFDRTGASSKFTPYEYSQTYYEAGSQKLNTGINDAKGYLVQVDAHRVSSNIVSVNLNGTSSSQLGTSPTHALGLEPGAKYDPIHSNVVFVPANSNRPSEISVDIGVGAWRATGDGGDEKYKIKVLGYFADDDATDLDLFYEKFDTPVDVASPVVVDGEMTEGELQPRDFKETPKAFLVNVTSKNIGSDLLKFEINKNAIYLGTSASELAKGNVAKSVHHSGLMYVKANPKDSYLFEMTPDFGGWKAIDSDAAFDVEIVGYFY